MSGRVLTVVLVAGCRLRFDELAPADATAPDAPSLVCPASYTVSLASTASRYRVSAGPVSFAAANRDCADDQPGDTHLVNIQALAEGAELGPHMDAEPTQPMLGRFYVGGVQLAAQAAVDASWFYLDGEPVNDIVWRSDEPDDLDGTEDELEQFATIAGERLMIDVGGGTPYGMICECDGIPIAPQIAAVLPP